MFDTAIDNVMIVNENRLFSGSVYIKEGRIADISEANTVRPKPKAKQTINGQGCYLIPGVIDDQVHFREPGLTHKATIYSESRAAVAGGITSYMEMPNTNPQTTTYKELMSKFKIAGESSIANHSFYMGATNTNLNELERIDSKSVCGIKVFMGSSTGNMLVDKQESLEAIFKYAPILIATHCEDEQTIKKNLQKAQMRWGDGIPIGEHANIRSAEACYKSSSKAVELAQKHNSRLHVLHLSSAQEMTLFSKTPSNWEKRITAEVCAHHLWFTDDDYEFYGTRIKWNPSIKTANDQMALWEALKDNRLDVIATDHAPHTLSEKQNNYLNAPSGGPLVQHSLLMMLEHYHNHKITLETIVDKMCHNPARIFQVKHRGFIRKGYWADLVLIDLDKKQSVTSENLLYKCQWSPMEGHTFNSKIVTTFVNGNIVYNNDRVIDTRSGMALEFDRP